MSSLLDDPLQLEGKKVPERDYTLVKFLGKGKNGVVYKAEGGFGDVAACKVLPVSKLQKGWEQELSKAARLQGIPEVVNFKQYSTGHIGNTLYVFIMWEYVEGESLRSFCNNHGHEVTLEFLRNLARQVLRAFYAMKAVDVKHGDLHEGNILIAKDPRVPEPQPRVRVTDFGIGSTSPNWKPADDYYQLAIICIHLLEKFVDRATLDNVERQFYDHFVDDFLQKRLMEKNPTVGSFVFDPRSIIEELDRISTYEVLGSPPRELEHPFDYLSCEQIGNSFELLQKLYSENFIGYSELTQRSNTILTGPRGCGKTTIFRNLSLRTKALAGKLRPKTVGSFVGVYYQCSDLYYCFPNLKDPPTDEERKTVVHYFDLALLVEILDTFLSIEKFPSLALTTNVLWELEGFLRGFMANYEAVPSGTSILKHLRSIASAEKSRVKKWLDSGLNTDKPEFFLPMDFLKRLCGLLQERVDWLKSRPFYFFIDDYSLPRISKAVQMTLGNFILDRYAECFFKISTESVTTLWPTDSYGKLLEETREYDLIDLGYYFLHAPVTTKRRFLRTIVNQRLKISKERSKLTDIASVLGLPPFKSYNELARIIRDSKKRIQYCGWSLVVDLCSGDIAVILRVIRDIFSLCKQRDKNFKLAQPSLQDQAIRDNANDFLVKIASVPDTGFKLKQVAEAFGAVAHWYLTNVDSGNVKTNPPKQAFRIEMRETPKLSSEQMTWYLDLIKYAIFLIDVRGKSQRGAVVPRLYLRSLLIPSFKLTPSRRDNIGLNPEDFTLLLETPDKFLEHMKNKERRVRSDRRQTKLVA